MIGHLSWYRGCSYIRRQPHSCDVQQRFEPSISALVFWHALNASLFDLQLAGETLCSGIPAGANLEALARNGIVVGNDAALSVSVDLV